jgi:glycosyltransferase involved in cell wall biosynthesis
MSPPADNPSSIKPDPVASEAIISELSDSRPAVSEGPTSISSFDPARAIFLMINSLETGGTERQFVEVARSLRNDGLRVQLGCLIKKGSFLEGLGEIYHSPLGGSLYRLRSLQSRWQLMRHLRGWDVAVAHSFDFYANLMLIPAAKLARVPVVIGSHRQLGDLLTPNQFRAQLAMFRLCDRVVCNSRAAADRLAQAGLPERKLAVVGNGLPASVFAETAPALPRREGILRVGMIARMNAAYKNHSIFLRAAARARRKFSNLEIVLVGDGPLRPELEREAAELGLQDSVIFLGDRRDIPATLACMDVSVVPSASESLSNVMLESMAAGIPVVASAVGGNVELAGDRRAVLVPPADAEALAAGLEKLLADQRLRSEMGRSARQFAQNNFSMERVRRQYADVYAEALAGRGKTVSETLSKFASNNISSERETNPASRAGSRIRVVLVAPTLRYVGGQSVQADLLMQNWKDDPEVEAKFVPVDPSQPYGLGWVERVPGLRTLLREPRYIFELWKNLKDADVVHIFSASYSSFLLAPLPAWLVARQRGKKTLINYRSGECRDHLQRSSIARSVLRGTDRLVVPSGYLVDVLKEFGLTAKVVPNIVDLSQFVFRVRRPLRPHLVCTRGFHPYYCIDIVVRAFAEVQALYPDAQLDLVGGGPIESEIRSLVSEMKLTGVNFTGVAARDQIGRCYDQADIFINASRLDNMPVSVLEAFASGTPVVSTEPESMRYLVEHGRTGLLSPPGEAHALAQNVIQLLQNPERAEQLATNARQEFQRYSWQIVREQWLGVYRGMTSKGARSAEVITPDPTSA